MWSCESCSRPTRSRGTVIGRRSRDARRYNAFVVAGWLVLRFAYEDVMHDPLFVREVLRPPYGNVPKPGAAPDAQRDRRATLPLGTSVYELDVMRTG